MVAIIVANRNRDDATDTLKDIVVNKLKLELKHWERCQAYGSFRSRCCWMSLLHPPQAGR